jgi:hypothetical protein
VHAQLTRFDGPRNEAQQAAFDRADFDRIGPALAADPQVAGGLVATYILHADDGGRVVVSVVQDEALLHRARDVIMATELLPGEDPALLPGPDRIETFRVVGMADAAHPCTARV